jgi:hypothetical protein
MLARGPGARAPRANQVRATEAVVQWYLDRYFGTDADPGVVARFCEPSRIGGFAVVREELAAGRAASLFRLLVATAMFQRRQDVQVQRILRGIRRTEARELTSARRLLALVDGGVCEKMVTNERLLAECDLHKDPQTKEGRCDANPGARCQLKRHTVLLKRYGHFGKVPTSAALMLRGLGVGDLPGLHAAILRSTRTAAARARALEVALTGAWRINQKIACMFLSAVTNPDLSKGLAPWKKGVDSSRFVVIDSNVDQFLASIGYRGFGTYDARRAFVQALALRIDLSRLRPGLQPYNPRLVQQALYVFMSAANRRAASGDCMHVGLNACRACPPLLVRRCPVRTRPM